MSSRLGVRDSVIGISTTTDPSRREANRQASRVDDCLGKAYDNDTHLSLVCHMAPRLSTSNIGFHDLFWSHYKDQVKV